MMQRVAIIIGLIIFAIGAISSTAHGVETARETTGPHHKPPSRVYIVQQVGHKHLYNVMLVNGHVWVIGKCAHDEVTGDHQQTCWWDGHRFGNHHGRSFAVLAGTVHRMASDAHLYYN